MPDQKNHSAGGSFVALRQPVFAVLWAIPETRQRVRDLMMPFIKSPVLDLGLIGYVEFCAGACEFRLFVQPAPAVDLRARRMFRLQRVCHNIRAAVCPLRQRLWLDHCILRPVVGKACGISVNAALAGYR